MKENLTLHEISKNAISVVNKLIHRNLCFYAFLCNHLLSNHDISFIFDFDDYLLNLHTLTSSANSRHPSKRQLLSYFRTNSRKSPLLAPLLCLLPLLFHYHHVSICVRSIHIFYIYFQLQTFSTT